ncbi:hypothetical protein, partial [Pseudoalteromonas nigrifaciens]|uniref:hypothetical protein n=1 Tax=Pseudoalteromonas nigrifaciens TaxID=28109 RepID=UPI003569BA7E
MLPNTGFRANHIKILSSLVGCYVPLADSENTVICSEQSESDRIASLKLCSPTLLNYSHVVPHHRFTIVIKSASWIASFDHPLANLISLELGNCSGDSSRIRILLG